MLRYLIPFLIFFSVQAYGFEKNEVELNVPVVAQAKNMCGPATIEMLFRYWSVGDYDQYDIAEAILNQFRSTERVVNSGVYQGGVIDWEKYPGTGTINIREFLMRFSSVKNIMVENASTNEVERKLHEEKQFAAVKESLSRGIPVIVHQYWSHSESRGHYRIVTGYSNAKRLVYLNDSDGGKKITQSYDEFLSKWNVNERWLHYNALIFNNEKKKLEVRL